MRLLELLWLVMVIRIRNTRLEMIKVKMVIVFGCGFQEDPHHSSPSYSPPAQLWGMWPGDSVGPLDQGSQK
jgi:hypothetical protein